MLIIHKKDGTTVVAKQEKYGVPVSFPEILTPEFDKTLERLLEGSQSQLNKSNPVVKISSFAEGSAAIEWSAYFQDGAVRIEVGNTTTVLSGTEIEVE